MKRNTAVLPKMTIHLVDEIEYEQGYGSRREDQYVFPNKDLAEAFVYAYNSKHNNKDVTPDWYMRQVYEGEAQVTESQFNKYRYKGSLVVIPEDWKFVEDK